MREFVYLHTKDTFTCPLCRDKWQKYASMPVASHQHLSIHHQPIGKRVMPLASMPHSIPLKLPRPIYKITCSPLQHVPRLQHKRYREIPMKLAPYLMTLTMPFISLSMARAKRSYQAGISAESTPQTRLYASVSYEKGNGIESRRAGNMEVSYCF